MSDSSLQLGDLLGELHRAGDVVSSGAFTIDLKHATEKLQKFQLANPFHYVLKLVQCAVASRATALSVVSNNERVTVRMQGVSFTPNELAQLFYYLVEAEATFANRALRSLATAINTAIGTKARRLMLESWNGNDGVRHEWTLEGPRQVGFRGGTKGQAHTEFVLQRNIRDRAQGWYSTANRDIFDLFFKRRSAMDREHAAVYDRCQYCPIPITLNGTALQRQGFGTVRYPGYKPGGAAEAHPLKTFASQQYNGGVLKTHHLLERWFRCNPTFPNSTMVAPASDRATVRLDRLTSNEPSWLGLAVPAALDGHSRIDIVEDGVLLDRKAPALGLPGFSAVVCGSLFPRDISGFKVGDQSDAWKEFGNVLVAETAQMLADFRVNRDQFPPRLARSL